MCFDPLKGKKLPKRLDFSEEAKKRGKKEWKLQNNFFSRFWNVPITDPIYVIKLGMNNRFLKKNPKSIRIRGVQRCFSPDLWFLPLATFFTIVHYFWHLRQKSHPIRMSARWDDSNEYKNSYVAPKMAILEILEVYLIFFQFQIFSIWDLPPPQKLAKIGPVWAFLKL